MPLPLSDDNYIDINTGLPLATPADYTPNQAVASRWPTYASNDVQLPNTATNIPIKASDRLPIEMPQEVTPVVTDNRSIANKVVDKLLGSNSQERYKLWPELIVHDALTAPATMTQANPYKEGTEEYLQFERERQAGMPKAALDMSALAGTGGLAGAGEGAGAATLGSSPFLRPALKYEGKIYKAPVGGQHMDAIPPALQDTFTKQAMSGDDITHWNFGFMNHKGQFLSREDALKYAIDQGLLSEHDAKFGALTSTLMADSSKEGAAIGALEKSKSPFYSTLEKNVADIGQSKMTGDQWLGTLANKAGIKPEEMDWTGLKDYLASKGKETISKDEVQAHLNSNKVELGEKVSHTPNPRLQEMLDLDTQARKLDASGDTEGAAKIREQIKAIPPTGDFNHRYKNYQLPGGENYKETLLTLPEKKFSNVNQMQEFKLATKNINSLEDVANARRFNINFRETFKNLDDNEVLKLANRAKTEPEYQAPYKSSHWDEPNILAHIRTNERDVNGVPSHHIEEIQSDWHQQGRDKGYASEGDLNKFNELEKQAELARSDLGFENVRTAEKAIGSSYAKFLQGKPSPSERIAAQEKIAEVRKNDEAYQKASNKVTELTRERDKYNPLSKVPDAPFKKSWPELAMKRSIRQAVEEGKSRVSWTPGEAQAARYDLSKQIDQLKYIKNDDGTYNMVPFKNNSPVHSIERENVKADEISNIVGKDVAKKIVAGEGKKEGDIGILEGLDLKVGGEGMKGFYDEMLPKMVEKIGKKYGVKVKEGYNSEPKYDNTTKQWYIPKQDGFFDTKEEALKSAQKVYYFDIPENMKKDVLTKGFPLFSKGFVIPTQREQK